MHSKSLKSCFWQNSFQTGMSFLSFILKDGQHIDLLDTTVTSLQEAFLCGLDSVAHYKQDHAMQLKAPLLTMGWISLARL